eukprot:TRINITY_DN12179_c0_g1_i1.p1 TRINITY_DN12179_c0_g1~~TRINITY_DN12179_c0_g1_i1.p1  ORF type:complete len:488 (+),score=131.98 TRINITY_DN12179_c0_g1_i1:125-1588(+)
MTLQVSSVRNASQPSKRQDFDSAKNSGDIPRLMTFFLSDGHAKVRACEFELLEGYKMADFIPGTKMILRNFQFKAEVVLLKPDVLVRSCGEVEELKDAWKVQRDMQTLRDFGVGKSLEVGEEPPPKFQPLDLDVEDDKKADPDQDKRKDQKNNQRGGSKTKESKRDAKNKKGDGQGLGDNAERKDTNSEDRGNGDGNRRSSRQKETKFERKQQDGGKGIAACSESSTVESPSIARKVSVEEGRPSEHSSSNRSKRSDTLREQSEKQDKQSRASRPDERKRNPAPRPSSEKTFSSQDNNISKQDERQRKPGQSSENPQENLADPKRNDKKDSRTGGPRKPRGNRPSGKDDEKKFESERGTEKRPPVPDQRQKNPVNSQPRKQHKPREIADREPSTTISAGSSAVISSHLSVDATEFLPKIPIISLSATAPEFAPMSVGAPEFSPRVSVSEDAENREEEPSRKPKPQKHKPRNQQSGAPVTERKWAKKE